jgi:hypothetical protein
VCQRCPIQLIPVLPPLRHESIQVTLEAFAVPTFNEMNHFMQDDILKTFARLLG